MFAKNKQYEEMKSKKEDALWNKAFSKNKSKGVFFEPKIKEFNISKSVKILDLGCGLGEDLEELRKEGYKNLVGIDITPSFVETCKNKGFNVLVDDMHRLSFDNEVFDIVFVRGVLHHTRRHEDVIKEAWRVLKYGGCFCIIEPKQSLIRKLIDFITLNMAFSNFLKYRKVLLEKEEVLYNYWFDNYNKFLRILGKCFIIEKVCKDNLFYACLKCKKREGF